MSFYTVSWERKPGQCVFPAFLRALASEIIQVGEHFKGGAEQFLILSWMCELQSHVLRQTPALIVPIPLLHSALFPILLVI